MEKLFFLVEYNTGAPNTSQIIGVSDNLEKKFFSDSTTTSIQIVNNDSRKIELGKEIESRKNTRNGGKKRRKKNARTKHKRKK